MAATQTASSLSSRRDGSLEPVVTYGPPQPASPTLTNPDTILPDYDHGPSFHRAPSSASSPLWSMAQSASADLASLPQTAYHAMPLGPSTPIIYGNGTMLSDIGEVTEVESIASSPPLRLASRSLVAAAAADGTPLGSSPTIGSVLVNNRLSFGSTGTINADLDDSPSVADSNFQGDDEESMASSYVDDLPLPRSVRPPALSMKQSRPSASAISKRAEHILASAKRRLTVRSAPSPTRTLLTSMQTMEGNLSRAKDIAYSPASDGFAFSPGARTVKSFDQDMLSKSSSNHARNVSDETGLRDTSRPVDRLQRSASALGVAGGYRQPLVSPGSADAPGCRQAHPSTKLSHHPLDTALAPLAEDCDDQDDDWRAGYRHDDARASDIASPALSSHSDASASRTSSAAQVRDLQEQMEGLKGKISSLRRHARADSMKRRSLQGLRTPSPFTHARWEQGYAESRGVGDHDQSVRPLESPVHGALSEGYLGGRPGVSRKDDAQALAEEDAPSIDGYHQVRGGVKGVDDAEAGRAPVVEEYLFGADDVADEERDLDAGYAEKIGVAETDGWSESGDSLYHDTCQPPVSHEDREDAFDYEHFFLHSAMGTLSRQQLGRPGSSGSSGSDASGDSVETTRGPMMSKLRRPSLDTFTSVESFNTAIEGRASRVSLVPERGPENGLAVHGQGRDDAQLGRTPVSVPHQDGDEETKPWKQGRLRHHSLISWSSSKTSTLHRPSVSSFESTGTNRSFPLVNRVRMNGGVLTPLGSPNQDVKQVSESLMSETASICDRANVNDGQPAMQMLSKSDQAMVERVVASLGRCVLGLTESSGSSSESQAEFRRRIDAAGKILEAGPGALSTHVA